MNKLMLCIILLLNTTVFASETTKSPSSSASSPVKYILNGVLTSVSQDTVVPANSTPLPVTLLTSPGGVPVQFNNDYGASAGALRTAAQVGNTTGAADFGAGLTTAQTLRVVNTTDQGPTSFQFVRLDYTVTNVDNTAYVQLTASTTAATTSMTMFDGGGYSMVLATGAPGVEVDVMEIPPGGFNGVIPIKIPAGTRLSIKGLEAVTVNAGQHVLNLLN